MAKKNTSQPETFIEINGKRYDVGSGRLESAPKIISDVMPANRSTIPAQPVPVKPVASTPANVPKRPQVMDIRAPHHMKAHQPEHPKTLMRSAVKKPVPGLKTHVRAVTRTDILAKPASNIVVKPKLSFFRTDPRREALAGRVTKSPVVQRFASNNFAVSPTAQQLTGVMVQTAATFQPAAQRSMDVFEKALARADAHTEPLVDHHKLARDAHKAAKHAHKDSKRPLHHRTTSLVAASLAVLLLCGFIAYQNKAAITLRYASAKAGFHANLPSYRPSGFAIGKFAYSTGKVSAAFDNEASHQQFTLTESPSNWDTQTLFEQLVASSSKSYQALERNGQTIYIYNDNSAAWVTGGVLYQLDSRANLSTSQVLDLAGSV